MAQQVKVAEAVHVTQAGHSTNEAGLPTDLPSDRIYMRRVHITPTRVLLFPASIETSNRVIRRWPEFQDNFLRVRFVYKLYSARIFIHFSIPQFWRRRW